MTLASLKPEPDAPPSNFEDRLAAIETRNQRVQMDKAWETSFARKILIMAITYICAALFLYLIGSDNFLIAALVPVIGYYLSTLSLPVIKQWWIQNNLHGE